MASVPINKPNQIKPLLYAIRRIPHLGLPAPAQRESITRAFLLMKISALETDYLVQQLGYTLRSYQ
jgi:hypothetical protein